LAVIVGGDIRELEGAGGHGCRHRFGRDLFGDLDPHGAVFDSHLLDLGRRGVDEDGLLAVGGVEVALDRLAVEARGSDEIAARTRAAFMLRWSGRSAKGLKAP
jgi:hypothetical protein